MKNTNEKILTIVSIMFGIQVTGLSAGLIYIIVNRVFYFSRKILICLYEEYKPYILWR